jgi:hypothetical protein
MFHVFADELNPMFARTDRQGSGRESSVAASGLATQVSSFPSLEVAETRRQDLVSVHVGSELTDGRPRPFRLGAATATPVEWTANSAHRVLADKLPQSVEGNRTGREVGPRLLSAKPSASRWLTVR